MYKWCFILSGMMILQILPTGSFAQDQCGDASIVSATYNYEIGRFTECIERLNTCLKTNRGYDFNQKIQAYHLLAECYLAVDSLNMADSVIEELLSLNDNFQFDFGDPERFRKAVDNVRSKPKNDIVSSVSKRNENIRFAPATTSVITQVEILQRGYTDLIDVLKDLPGFDISVYYGKTYANVFQRGLQTSHTDKTLILVDGVEDNDLWSYFGDISQQYPIASIKQIEVVYGPSSTMYGPNAFAGVINIVTKDPKNLMHDGRLFGIHANAGVGSYNTKFAELNAGFKNKNGIFSFSATARVYNSDRPDLSSQKWWDFDPYLYDTLTNSDYYDKLIITRKDSLLLTAFKNKYANLPGISAYATFVTNRFGDTIGVVPTTLSDSLARNSDKAAYARLINGVPGNSFINSSKSYYINAKVTIGDLSLGLVSWDKTEGSGTSSTDKTTSISGTSGRQSHKYFYLDYNKRLNPKLLFSTFINYRIHTSNNGSRVSELNNYDRTNLNLYDLLGGVASSWLTTYYYEKSTQFRSEFKLVYSPNKKFNLVSGIEIRNSQLPGYLLISDFSSVPEDYGIYSDSLPGGNQFDVNDAGIYSQASYRTNKNNLGFTLGARLDHDKIRQEGGLGYTFSPRAVVDYSPTKGKKWIFKMIFSKGIEGVSNSAKYNDEGHFIPNPSLKTEAIYNYEFAVSNKLSEKFAADADFYYSKVKDVVAGELVAPRVRQNQNIGEFTVYGMQSNFYYRSKKLQLTANYTFTHSRQTKDVVPGDSTYMLHMNTNELVSGIAPHKANFIANYIFFFKNDKRLNLNLRTNYISDKPYGGNADTAKAIINHYIICNMAISAENIFKGATIQFICNNIFNKEYYNPGIGQKNPVDVFQMKRNFSLRINYEF